jgi:hypothetical protein
MIVTLNPGEEIEIRFATVTGRIDVTFGHEMIEVLVDRDQVYRLDYNKIGILKGTRR